MNMSAAVPGKAPASAHTQRLTEPAERGKETGRSEDFQDMSPESTGVYGKSYWMLAYVPSMAGTLSGSLLSLWRELQRESDGKSQTSRLWSHQKH